MDKTFDNGFAEKLTTAGSKVVENSGKLGEIGATAFKRLMDGQLELASAFANLGASQFQNLAKTTAPTEFLQRQKELGDSFNETLNGYVEGLRQVGAETQAAYTAVAKDFAADLGVKTAV